MLRKIITPIYLRRGEAVSSFTDPALFGGGDAVALARDYSNRGADILMIFDQSVSDVEHDASLMLMREMARVSDIPMWGAGNVKRVEDIKKILYAGCKKAVLNYAKPSNMEMLEEVSKRFGREKIAVCINAGASENPSAQDLELIRTYARDVVVLSPDPDAPGAAVQKIAKMLPDGSHPFCLHIIGAKKVSRGAGRESFSVSAWDLSSAEVRRIIKENNVEGIGGAFSQDRQADIPGMKALLKADGMEVNLYESTFSWDELKKTDQGLIPVVVQDYRNEEVLMVAYMNREAYEKTIRTGVMTYWSRSRQELWVKGLTSGHYQYLKELRVDCDSDTLLARVEQIGAACHTGNRSCFYRTALKKDTPQRNPIKVFEDVYATIEDRKLHPREGSYTNYLFRKGIDKILKKCGEEAAEIIIAAKNPNPEEIKYEAADFLYHLMVLMAERGITWQDIAQELANRE